MTNTVVAITFSLLFVAILFTAFLMPAFGPRRKPMLTVLGCECVAMVALIASAINLGV